MKEVYRTLVPGQAHTMRLALEAEGIKATVVGEGSLGVVGVAEAALLLVDESDLEAARKVLVDLEAFGPPHPATRSRMLRRLGLGCAGPGLVLMIAGAIARVGASSDSGEVTLFVLAGLLILAGIVLVFAAWPSARLPRYNAAA